MSKRFTLAGGDWMFFGKGQLVTCLNSADVDVVTGAGPGGMWTRTATTFEIRRSDRGKHWVGRRYEMPATQRRRMERDRVQG